LNSPSFKIYNASAGSGKTFTLVKEYLKILFKSNKKEEFKHILAITFTNKAVAEMKERIIENLKLFSNKSILEKPNSMFNAICNELNWQPITLHEKSEKLLENIMHNYAAFDISTIDGFTHKLIRTFAYDLKIPLNFEVELDQESLLNEAVDSLISKAGIDKPLTKILVDFAIEKADDDKSWDVSYDFNKIAKLLVSENDIPFIEILKSKSIDDFNSLKELLKDNIKHTERSIIEDAKSVLTLIQECGLESNDFSSGYLPKHFENLADGKFDLNFDTKWQSDLLENNPLYPKRVTQEIASVINSIHLQLILAFNETKQAIFQLKFLKSFHKNITPLSVLNAINKELKTLKDEQNKMLISEFNSIISNEIKEQPTPFIYERIGEKFNHYFVDEFQDTSVLQWENLVPLIGNSLSAEKGSAMIVGDAKQAIYRWRGGRAEQFINLYNKTSKPFLFIDQEIFNLPTNYRSFKEIVTFNNNLFKYLASKVFSNQDYEGLYQNSYQNNSLEETGYVNINFLEIDKEDDRDEMFSVSVLNTIKKCIENNYEFEDICVLVRKKNEGVAVANYLSQHNIPIISSETLLINNAPEINFINDLLSLLIQPKNNEIKASLLNYLTTLFKIDDKHEFFSAHINLSITQLFKRFEAFGVYINSNALLQLSLYELTETIVRSFKLVEKSNAYVQFYLDFVLDYVQKKGSEISSFLEYFNKKKDSLSVVSPIGQNAVQIMTIHKSKGLEFPIVIFPYADLDIYFEKEPKEWFPLEKDTYNGFSHTLLNFNKDFEFYGNDGLSIYTKHKSEQELDNINLLYVALTRAIQQLYIISKKDISSKGDINEKKYSGLFINYLTHLGLWNDTSLTYSFGNCEKPYHSLSEKTPLQELEFISTAKEDHNIKIVTNSGYLWDTNLKEAIEKGNLIHSIMSNINTKDDVDFVLNDFIESAVIDKNQAAMLKKNVLEIIEHPKLKDCFVSEHQIYNERDIITINGQILRPDRVIINSKNEAIIIDYKTGQEDKRYIQQIITYQDVLESMNFKVVKKFLVYINDVIQVKEI